MKDNMEELQRWDLWRDPEFPNDRSIEKCHNGDFVLFSDVQARLEAADRLAVEMAAALAAYRSTGESAPAPDETEGKA
jgi:hypothetical protein